MQAEEFFFRKISFSNIIRSFSRIEPRFYLVVNVRIKNDFAGTIRSIFCVVVFLTKRILIGRE